jgi:pimeloyl-ACP methyl ester carboxylesterase
MSGSAQPVIFLPGIIMPCALRYAALLRELDGEVSAVTKDLEVYAGPSVPAAGYSIAMEVEGIHRAADAAGFDRFHLYGHSGGGACALAYVAAHPERVLSLAVDEPASAFIDTEASREYWPQIERARALPESERMPAFLRLQLGPDVPLPVPPDGPPPPWMANRAAGVAAGSMALQEHHVDESRYRAFERPVYFSHGSLSHPVWQEMRITLAGLFPCFTAELYAGLHHLHTSHQAQPARVAAALRRHWSWANELEARSLHRSA